MDKAKKARTPSKGIDVDNGELQSAITPYLWVHPDEELPDTGSELLPV
jgi:hypothetical protein